MARSIRTLRLVAQSRALTAALALSVAAGAAACADDPSNSAETPDASADAGVADVAASDAGADAADVAPPDVAAPQFDAPPLVATTPWTELSLTWIAGAPHEADDGARTRAALEAGEFFMPTLGTDADRVLWSEVEPDENGVFSGLVPRRAFLASAFNTDEPTGIIVQADSAFTVWIDGRRQPGDIYRSGRTRVPFAVDAGEHWIAVEAFPPRGAPRVRVWTTPDAIAFNDADALVPDLTSGSQAPAVFGVPILYMGTEPSGPLRVRVVADDVWSADEGIVMPGVAPGSATQLTALAVPAAPIASDVESVEVAVQVQAPELGATWQFTLTVPVVDAATTRRQTFVSAMDGSAQYYGLVPPSDMDAQRDDYGLILSLHGAGVEGIGQARAYSAKSWAWLIAPTNRRPFGFDWEVFGRVDAIESLEDAAARLPHDPARVHVTGHSMGGHGTWQIGVLFPDRFATVGPSAGWSSFYSYTGETRPTGVFARSQASSETNNYAGNLAQRSVYIIHGDADDNVPVREARDMFALMQTITDRVTYHEQPGAGHWWDGDAAPGADCVDWPALMDEMESNALPALERSFSFRSPSPWVSPRFAWATVTSVNTPLEDFELTAAESGDGLELTTQNVRALRIDAAALRSGGVDALTIDGQAVDLSAADQVSVGPVDEGKRAGLNGPVSQAFERPFCFVANRDDADMMAFAAWLTSTWAVYGNGQASTIAADALDDWARQRCQLVYLGVERGTTGWSDALPLAWDAGGVTMAGTAYDQAAGLWVYPETAPLGDVQLAAAFVAPDGRADLLYRVSPFQSRFVVPDVLLWSDAGALSAGFFDSDWQFDPTLMSQNQ